MHFLAEPVLPVCFNAYYLQSPQQWRLQCTAYTVGSFGGKDISIDTLFPGFISMEAVICRWSVRLYWLCHLTNLAYTGLRLYKLGLDTGKSFQMTE